MFIGMYIDGRRIGYDAERYRFYADATPISTYDLASADASGYVVWSTPEMCDWFRSVSPDNFEKAASLCGAPTPHPYALEPAVPQPAPYQGTYPGYRDTYSQMPNSTQSSAVRKDSRKARWTMVALAFLATIAVIGAIAMGAAFAHIVHEDYVQAMNSEPFDGDEGYRT